MSSYEYMVCAPYALYIGAATDIMACKTATGLVHWRPDLSVCQVNRDGCTVDLNIPKADSAEHAWALGARTLIITILSDLAEEDRDVITSYIKAGFDIAGTFHTPIDRDAKIASMATVAGVRIVDLRTINQQYSLATGSKRKGLRLLTCGSDGNIGKKFTALTLTRAAERFGINCTFRPTGQTGRLIAGPNARAVVVDTVPADFASGAVEWLTSANNDPGHWDIIEGQGGIGHPAWGMDSMALLYGAQPDLIVFCVDPSRKYNRRTELPIMGIAEDVDLCLQLARRVNPRAHLGAFSVNRSRADENIDEFYSMLDVIASERIVYPYDIPIFDPSSPTAVDSIKSLMNRMNAMSLSATSIKGDQ